MRDLQPAARLDALPLYPLERAELLDLLSELKADEWAAPTECPAWSVKGIALHILGDDLSLLSRQRDQEPSGVAIEPGASFEELFVALDRFNEQWVEAASHFGTPLLLELLRLSGEWTHRFYGTVDGDRLGEPVPWIGPDPAPYWLLTAREYFERWIHHLQIRRAVGRPGLMDEQHVVPAVATAVRGFPQGFSILPADDGTTFTLSVTEQSAWTLRKDGDAWTLLDGAADDPTVRLSLDLETAALLFSRGLTAADLNERLTTEGTTDLGVLIVAGLAVFFGR
jgi:uncharacterized protein (TIGR03083 family)